LICRGLQASTMRASRRYDRRYAMSERRFGVGPWFVLLSGVYTAAAIIARAQDPAFFRIPFIPPWLRVGLAVLLLAIGVPFFAVALVQLIRGFPAGELFTGGVYRMCRHPVYGAWVVFNVPGMVLLLDNWIGLAVPMLMYVTLRVLVRREERELEQLFGDAYRSYRARTPSVFPLLWRWR
jgi:protein-S-isoprenylcysteine O-methyltransferase Ste14